jgi:omega-6 fatty acid desaturase (delta-12 desaturase)
MPTPSNSSVAGSVRDFDSLKKTILPFQTASARRAVWQLLNSCLPYLFLWYVMYRLLFVSYWLMLPVAILAAGFLARIFIIFHDCGHASFFRSRRANNWIGAFTGLLNLTPYRYWRWQHALHHGTSGDLDKRGSGDIWTMTVQEFLEASRWTRFAYRLARNPVVLFVLAPVYVFVIHQRFALSKAPRRERNSVFLTNMAIIATALLISAFMGLKAFLMIQLTVSTLTGAIGIWLFYVQHQFVGAYWERSAEWDYAEAAFRGSSYYKLPKILQWFTGNIGFHHVHHLSPRVPNYYLQRCHEAEPLFRMITPITVLSSLQSLTFRLWDERAKVFVGYRAASAA